MDDVPRLGSCLQWGRAGTLGRAAGRPPSAARKFQRRPGFHDSFDIKLAAVGGLALGTRRSSKCPKLQVRATPKLPVEDILEDLRSALNRPPHAAVLVAPPGAGKTTAVPLALLDDIPGGIVVTEPRRMAARAAARRMASMLGEPVGQTVGYRTRYESCMSSRTRVQVITDGILARQLQADATLPKTSAVLFDEFHERGLGNDLALTLCLHSQHARRQAGLPDLRMVAMSATLSERVAGRLGDLFDGCEILRSQGREFEVELRHSAKSRRLLRASRGFEKKADLAKVVAEGACEALQWTGDDESTPGDVLCFLPGEAEIRQCKKHLEARLRTTKAPKTAKTARAAKGFGAEAASTVQPLPLRAPVDVYPLHGALDAEVQDKAIMPALSGRRRVILATNVAEASITVEGVTAVVDSGLRKRSVFDPATGFNRLELVPISNASAEQRKGRAGRLRNGLCLRLWAPDQQLQPEDVPAIKAEDLTSALLRLLDLGVAVKDITNGSLPWLDPPPVKSTEYAADVLRRLQAIQGSGDKEERLTPHGHAMARLPLHPRLAHMVLRAEDSKDGPGPRAGSVATLCALLEEERDVLQDSQRPGLCADVATRLRALHGEDLPQRYRNMTMLPKHCSRVMQNAKRLQEDLKSSKSVTRPGPLLALAFPERVARRGKKGRFILRDGSSCTVKDPLLQNEDFLAVGRLKNKVVTLAAPLLASEAAVHILP